MFTAERACGIAALLLISVAQVSAMDVGAGSDHGYGVTYVNGAEDNLSESALSQKFLQAASGKCFLETIKIGDIRTCSLDFIPYEWACITMRNNILGNMLESASHKNHYAIQTAAAKMYINYMQPKSAPTNKKLGQDLISGESGGSSRGMARTISRPIVMTAILSLASGVSYDTLCLPNMPEGGSYIFIAEGDEKDSGDTVWRAIISPYYTNMMTSGLSLYATALETSGFCFLDLDYILCFGGWGAKYPTSGSFPAKSPALSAITAMWRAQEVHAAAAMTYGPYDTSLGFGVHQQLHDTMATAMGGGAQLAPWSPMSWMQWLHPGIPAGTSAEPQTTCDVLGEGPGTSFQLATQILGETVNKTWIEDNAIAFAYWPRFVCCKWCYDMGAEDSAAEHMIPEKGYDPVLTRQSGQ